MVRRQEESISIFRHSAAVDLINDRLPMPAADLSRSLHIRGKMHIQPALWNEPLLIDGRDVLLSRTMPENIRWDLLLQLHIHRNGMALVRADQRMILIEGISTYRVMNTS